MCGRFSLTSSLESIMEQFELYQGFYMTPRYNIAPGTIIPVQKERGKIDFLEWGFKQTWNESQLKKNALINARAETILEKPLFKQAFLKRRCLILADGFYEWKTIGRSKQPFYCRRKDKKPFAFAGIYQQETCAILTMEANAWLATTHARMPVILERAQRALWLNPKTPVSDLLSLLKPETISITPALFEMYPVTPVMNRPEYDSPSCVYSLQN